MMSGVDTLADTLEALSKKTAGRPTLPGLSTLAVTPSS